MSNPQSSLSELPKYLFEGVIPKECEDLISSLPSEEGWIGGLVYQYQGIWLPSTGFQGYLNLQKHFKANDTDIILSSFPKSGTTWLKALTFALTNRTEYRNFRQDHPLLKTSPHVLIPSIELDLFAGNQGRNLMDLPSLRHFATHLPIDSLPESMKISPCKIVYMCRNPKDTFVSFWQFMDSLKPKELGDVSLEKLFEMFCRGVTPAGSFWDHVLGYWKVSLENPKRVLFLSYEEMKEQPVKQLKKLAEFLDCSFSAREESDGIIDDIVKLCSLDNLSNLDVTKTGFLPMGIRFDAFYRRGVVGDWKNYFTDEMEEKMDKISEEKLHGYGLRFHV